MIRLDLLSTMGHITEKISPLYPVYFDLTNKGELVTDFDQKFACMDSKPEIFKSGGGAGWWIAYGTSDWTYMIGGNFIRIFAKDKSILIMLKLLF